MERYLKSRGISGPAWDAMTSTSSSLHEAGVAVYDGVAGVKEIYTPFGEAIDDAMNFQIDDMAYAILPDALWDTAVSAVDSAVVGNWQTKWDEFHNMSLRNAIKQSVGGASDPITVIHGRRMDPTNYDEIYRYPQHVSLIRGSNPESERQNLFTMFADESPYNQPNFLDTISVGKIVRERPNDRIPSTGQRRIGHRPDMPSEGRIYAPFSKFTPTALWPWQTTDGKRMTAADLGEVPIESDWLGTKPIAEALIGQELDKVGGIPGYRFWGDIPLALPAITTIALGLTALFFTWPLIAQVGAKVGSDLGMGTAKASMALVKP
jgi:hypothetical protein